MPTPVAATAYAPDVGRTVMCSYVPGHTITARPLAAPRSSPSCKWQNGARNEPSPRVGHAIVSTWTEADGTGASGPCNDGDASPPPTAGAARSAAPQPINESKGTSREVRMAGLQRSSRRPAQESCLESYFLGTTTT